MSNDDLNRLRELAGGKEVSRDFTKASLAKALLTSAKLEGAIFDQAKLNGAEGSGAYLKNASFRAANLTNAKFRLTDLRAASFVGANLKGADFASAILYDADFTDADLSQALLTKAMVRGTTFTNANFEGTDLRGVKDMPAEVIRTARNWQQAIFDPPTAKLLSIDCEEQVARHGRRKSSDDCLCIEVLTGEVHPTLGDLFQITGDAHPKFPPSGRCNLKPLGRFRFEQVDDAFAMRVRDEEVIWLIPVEHHQPGTLKGLRLELVNFQKTTVTRYLQVIEALQAIFQAGLAHVPTAGASEPMELDAVRVLLQQRSHKRQ